MSNPSVLEKGSAITLLQSANSLGHFSHNLSLGADQVTRLIEKGIPATLLGSVQKNGVTREILSGQYWLVFSMPESFYDRVTHNPQSLFLEMAEAVD